MTLMESDLTALVTRLGESLHYSGEQVSATEPYTGDGITEVTTRIPESSGWLEAGYVVYLNRREILQLEVPESLSLVVGVVSREVVEVMVRGAQWYSGVRFTVVVSGVIGPDGDPPEKPVGMVWLTQVNSERLVSERCQFNGDRDVARQQMVATALTGLLHMSNGENPG